jgi:hypothetical protein
MEVLQTNSHHKLAMIFQKIDKTDRVFYPHFSHTVVQYGSITFLLF